jgi:alkanesulfonate monooxygenase SsuD/methylene tetrahydromethanopterin reductase-like flavin-dependent oxidoreductase (luciferase family)
MFMMRFDMRARDGPSSSPGLYAEALKMAAWAEGKSCGAVHVSEHHGSSDGYLSAPIPMAAALAACTKTTPIQVAALQVPLHDPIHLAEQMAVADLLSGGRISYICVVGYRAEEYAMFGRPTKGRGRALEECIDVLRRAWTGEPFEYQGRRVCVQPTPATPGGPVLLMGGGAEVVARRAARLGMGMVAQGGAPSLEAVYRAACDEYGTTPGLFVNPIGIPTSCFVAEDPDRAWHELGPYLLHDAKRYAEWIGDGETVTKSLASNVDELRADPGNYRIFTPAEAVEHVRSSGVLLTQPLCGGIPPELAWPSLELIATEVIPGSTQPSP